jgi:hypothetical protein
MLRAPSNKKNDMLRKTAPVFALFLSLIALPLHAERQLLGKGRLSNNDSIVGDWQDRWQTGSVASSRVWGSGFSGSLPRHPGELLELRLNYQVTAPSRLTGPFNPNDRPLAGSISVGGHTHFAIGDLETAVGLDLVMIGPQTGMIQLQNTFHQFISIPRTSTAVLDGQIGNGLYPTAVLELGRGYPLGASIARPFFEARIGAESLVRTGFDITLGTVGNGELLVRDPVSGHRYRTIWNSGWRGHGLVVGADISFVSDTIFLPSSGAVSHKDKRVRVRAGYHWQTNDFALFYGLTLLSKEFETQPENQLIGSIRLRRSF